MLSITCLGLQAHPWTPGNLVINEQGRVSLAFTVFRENQSQDAGLSAGATKASPLVDGAPVGSQALKDLGGVGSASFLSVGIEGYGSESYVWQGNLWVITCTEGPVVVSDAPGNEMIKLPSSPGD